MDNFFRNVALEDAQNIEQAARLIFELRENRAALLMPYAVADEAALLVAIAAGQQPEHPTYERYLSARILERTRQTLRRELAGQVAPGSSLAPASGEATEDAAVHHFELKEALEKRYADRLDGEPQLMQDALALCFAGGLIVELRVAAADHYAFSWLWGDAELRIDTAPRPGATGVPASHFHDADGMLRDDPVTQPGRAPLDNIAALLDALLVDPLLERRDQPEPNP
ncbi:MAG: hypothetical protein ACM3X0_12650 [Bacteroidota bacterium]